MEKGGSLRRVLSVLVVLLLASAVFVGAGSAATTYYVNDTGGSDTNNGLSPSAAFKTIEHAVFSAIDGDIIKVAPGTYSVTNNTDLFHPATGYYLPHQLLINKGVTIEATGSAEETIITASNIGGNAGQQSTIYIAHSDVTIDGFTIEHVADNPNKVIEVTASISGYVVESIVENIIIKNCVINSGGESSAVYIDGTAIGSYTIEGNTFIDTSICIVNGAGSAMKDGEKALITGNTLTNVVLLINGQSDSGWNSIPISKEDLPEITGNTFWQPPFGNIVDSTEKKYYFIRNFDKDETKLMSAEDMEALVDKNAFDDSYIYSVETVAATERPGTASNKAHVVYLIATPAITFHANDGTGAKTTQVLSVIDENTQIPLDTNTFKRVGYTFSEWNTQTDGEGTSYADKESVPSQPVNLYAQWTINKTTITFDTNGGKPLDPITGDYGTAVTVPTPEKEGYTFKGWDKETPTTMPAEDMTLTAKWEINEGTTDPEVPGDIVNVNENTATFDAANNAVVEEKGNSKTVTITAAPGVTIQMTGESSAVTENSDGSVIGTFNTINVVFEDLAAESTEGSASYGLNIPMNVAGALAAGIPMPTITSTFDEGVANKVAGHNGNSYNSLAMIQATGVAEVNRLISGKVTVTFYLPANVGQNLVVFHVVGNDVTLLKNGEDVTITRENGKIRVDAKGDHFSSYIVAQDTTPRTSSTPQGSSVWLQEIPTETPTPTETVTPTETQPVETQPTPTQTEAESPLSVLAVLAGLGAVAVIRRR